MERVCTISIWLNAF